MNSSNEIKKNIKPLVTRFKGRGEVKGYLFALLGMTDKAFLCQVSCGNGKRYEVFKKKENSRYGCVSYPTSAAFGIWAWTFSDLKSAIKKYNELNFNQ